MNLSRTASAIIALSLATAACGRAGAAIAPGSTTTTVSVTTTTAAGDAAGAEAKWKALHATDYSFHYVSMCFCRHVSGTVTVAHGAVTRWRADGVDDANDPTLSTLPTIDSLLATAADAGRKATGAVTITYDPTTGAPLNASIDWLKEAVDDEQGWAVSDLVLATS
jgi:hypothetical protein